MKKQIRRLLSAAAGSLAALFLLTFPAAAARQFENCISNVGVYDIQGVLSEQSLSQAAEKVQETSRDIDMYVAVCIVGPETAFYSDSDVESYADDRYDELFNPQDGTDTDGVLLLINNSTNYDYLSTSGTGQLYYYNGSSDDRTWQILENITPYLKDADYSGAIYRFCEDLKYYYEKGMPDDSYSYDNENDTYYYNQGGQLQSGEKLPWWFGVRWAMMLPVSAIIGVITALIAVLCVKSSYKLKKSLSPMNYVSQQDTHFYVQEDVFLRKHISKTHISSDSGRSGGGGGGGHSHMSSGGHSHGGGGHHR